MSAAKGVSEGGYLWGCDENGKHLGLKPWSCRFDPCQPHH
jgi:hypothetical protein